MLPLLSPSSLLSFWLPAFCSLLHSPTGDRVQFCRPYRRKEAEPRSFLSSSHFHHQRLTGRKWSAAVRTGPGRSGPEPPVLPPVRRNLIYQGCLLTGLSSSLLRHFKRRQLLFCQKLETLIRSALLRHTVSQLHRETAVKPPEIIYKHSYPEFTVTAHHHLIFL